MRRRTAIFTLVLFVLAAVPPVVATEVSKAAAPRCGRIVAIGDLHGGYEAFLSIVRETGLVDEDLGWIGGDACLVQLGDIVDRGPRSRKILDLLMGWEGQAHGRLHVLLGNHEVLNLVGDLRYVHRGEFAVFAEDETEAQRAAGYAAFRRSDESRGVSRKKRRSVFDKKYPPGWFAHREAFSPDGRYGKWLLARPAVLELDGTVFCHGGLARRFAEQGIDAVNATLRRQTVDYASLRRGLVDRGWLNPLTAFGPDFIDVERKLKESRSRPKAQRDLEVELAAGLFLDLRDSLIVRPDSPIWDRTLAMADEQRYAKTLAAVLQAVDAERIVVAHTTQQGGRIRARFDGRVFLIDTGAGPFYDGRVSALEIRDGAVRAIYPGETEVLVEPTSVPAP